MAKKMLLLCISSAIRCVFMLLESQRKRLFGLSCSHEVIKFFEIETGRVGRFNFSLVFNSRVQVKLSVPEVMLRVNVNMVFNRAQVSQSLVEFAHEDGVVG